MKYKPGDIIKVKVGGVEYDTVITPDGIQRFKENSLIRFLRKNNILDLNKIAELYYENPSNFTQRDYAEFNMMLGYSVSGFRELSSFEDMEIENPLWEE